jgi:hypothetical protein
LTEQETRYGIRLYFSGAPVFDFSRQRAVGGMSLSEPTDRINDEKFATDIPLKNR